MNNKRNRSLEYEVDLAGLLNSILRHWWLVLLAAVGGALIMFAYTRFFVTPLYQSNVSFYVNNGQRSEDKISNADITASQNLVDTYIVILKYGTTLDEVIEDAELNYTASQLAGKIDCKAINGTEVFQVMVTDPSPEMAAKIAKSIAKVLPKRVADVIEGSSVKIVREANVPTSPFSPNTRKNVLIGAIAGIILSSLIVSLRFILDDRIRDAARMLKEQYSYPVLAVIPDLTGSSKGYYYHSQAKGS